MENKRPTDEKIPAQEKSSTKKLLRCLLCFALFVMVPILIYARFNIEEWKWAVLFVVTLIASLVSYLRLQYMLRKVLVQRYGADD